MDRKDQDQAQAVQAEAPLEGRTRRNVLLLPNPLGAVPRDQASIRANTAQLRSAIRQRRAQNEKSGQPNL
ncbi:MAG: hypothetical protein EPO40_01715 [Myxococcaceae bacterium]|nr:MAG: hypothetical protein EPO40_01715 [Myxococcaceae bacterium]